MPNFRKCGEKSITSEHNPIFGNKTAGRGGVKPGSGRQISAFPRTSGIPKRKYAANSGTPRAHRSFRAKKPQVEALPLSGAVGMSGICRILPDLTFCLTLIPSQSAAKRRAPFLICLESCLWGGGFAVFGRAPARTGLFGSSASRPPSEDVLKTGLKLPCAYIDIVQYACLTMAKVDFRGGVRHGGAGCWQHCVC